MKNLAKAPVSILRLSAVALLTFGCSGAPTVEVPVQPVMNTVYATSFEANPREPRLRNLRMLTHSGENAEAYFSPDGQRLIFQASIPGVSRCDQIFVMDTSATNVRRVSNGEGRTTCAYFIPGTERVVYASTHHESRECPAPPDMSRGYVWALYDYDIYTSTDDGRDIRRLTTFEGYDAEATVSRDGRRIIFTSTRDGDLDLYSMDRDGSNVVRLTDTPGYDGGAFYSHDGTKIIYRAHHPKDERELADYRSLLAQNLVRPTTLDIWIMDADGSNKKRLTNNNAANFAPFMHPDGRRVIFSSNMSDPAKRDFDLYLVNIDSGAIERVTYSADFDGFPMFSPDGKKLVFGSNRGAVTEGDTNIFLADWVD